MGQGKRSSKYLVCDARYQFAPSRATVHECLDAMPEAAEGWGPEIARRWGECVVVCTTGVDAHVGISATGECTYMTDGWLECHGGGS